MNSEEEVMEFSAFRREQPNGSATEVVIFAVSKLINVHCT